MLAQRVRRDPRPSPRRSATTRCATAGTIGGSVAHGDPASDLPAALLALDATFVAHGPERRADDRRRREFFEGFLETALAPDELLTEIRVPKTGANGFAFEKFNRRAQDWAIVGAVAARVNGGTQVALVNMGSTPLRATAVEQALAQGASATDAAARAAEGTEPTSDLNASPEYREHLARVLVRRALEATAPREHARCSRGRARGRRGATRFGGDMPEAAGGARRPAARRARARCAASGAALGPVVSSWCRRSDRGRA